MAVDEVEGAELPGLHPAAGLLHHGEEPVLVRDRVDPARRLSGQGPEVNQPNGPHTADAHPPGRGT